MVQQSETFPQASSPAERIPVWVLVPLAVAVLAALAALFAGLGTRWGLWHFRTGFTILRWAAYGGIAAALLGILAAIGTRPGTGRKGFALALLALVIGGIVFYFPWQQQRIARSVPPIHDITTDTSNPPQFVAIVPLRAGAANPVEYPGGTTAQQQQEAYPDIRPVILDDPLDVAFDRALSAAQRQGWTIVAAERGEGRIEATTRTFWFGFHDDIVIRLTPVEGRTVLDIRSKSRVGRSDVGANARRIRAYIRTLTE